MIHSDRLWDAFWRQVLFSAIILAIEVPAGHLHRAEHAEEGLLASVCLILMRAAADPVQRVGTIWQIFGRVDIGLLGHTLAWLGVDYNNTNDALTPGPRSS